MEVIQKLASALARVPLWPGPSQRPGTAPGRATVVAVASQTWHGSVLWNASLLEPRSLLSCIHDIRFWILPTVTL
jgi:hypothetical protein